MRTPLRVAALSFWHVHAGDYCRRTQEHPETELVAIWDDDPDRGAHAAAEFGVEPASDLESLLARDDIDAVTVTTATVDHRHVMVAAARAGKHIFTEKLLAPTVAECEEILAAADSAGVAVTVSLPRLYHGSTLAVADQVASGDLGEITYARVRLSHDGAVRDWLPERFYDADAAIGGALTDLGCHPVYLVQLLLGAAPDTVSATYRDLTGRGVDDHAVVTVGYPDQRIGVIEAGFVSRTPFSIEVYGTRGALLHSDRDRVLRRQIDGGAWQEVPIGEDGPDAYTQWVGHIRDGTRADENLTRAVDLTRLVAAANESAVTDRVVSLSPTEGAA